MPAKRGEGNDASLPDAEDWHGPFLTQGKVVGSIAKLGCSKLIFNPYLGLRIAKGGGYRL